MTTRTRTDFKVDSQKVKWDPKTVEIKTRSVEKTLEPLVHQVTTLVNHQRKGQKSGKSKKAHQLAREIDEATERLVVVGESIAQDFPDIREPMLEACKEARAAGDTMRTASREFADDPCSSAKRSTMIRAARALLSAVTRLLCIADMADVYRLLATLRMVEDRLKELQDADNSDDLMKAFKNYGDDLMKLAKLSGLRQSDLKDPKYKDDMAHARATLKKSSRMLLTTSKTFVRHPEVASAKHNRDFVMQQINDAVNSISGVARGDDGDGTGMPYSEIGALARALEDLLKMVNNKPADLKEKKNRMELEKQLDEILAGAARLADSSCTRDNTRDRIIAECNNVKQALQYMVDEAMKHAKGKPNSVPAAKEKMQKKTKDLGKQLRKAIIDHVSDSFLETNVPLILLIEAALAGNEREVEECAVVFTEHAAKLEEVANLACSMSSNPEGVKMVRIAAKQLHSLCPQVINAARTLAARPRSKVAKENMDVFRDAWINQVKVLTEAVDDITTIDDFLAVSEAHILEDVNRCVKALQCGDPETLDRTAGAIRGREARVDNVVTAEMDNFEPGPYTETVKHTVLVMRDSIMPQFAEHVNAAVDALNQDPQGEVDENAFIDAAKLVYEGIRDIRRAVMMRKKGEEESDEEDAEDQPTYITSLADAQERQRDKLAFEQLKAGGKMHFEIHSEGGDDPGVKGNGVASIMINGAEYSSKRRGHNIVVVDQIGNVVSTRTFDTQDPSEGMAMAKFLDEIPDDHIALIAVQDTSGKGIEKASEALKRLGADEPIDPGSKGSWAFAGYKGQHTSKNWVTQVTRPRYHGPAMISDVINTPAFDQGKVKIEITSETPEDEGYARIASIKVNSIERSLNGRGFNVVILDAAGRYLTSKSFDTVDAQHGRAEGQKMAQFLDELPSERMVCIAALEATGDGMDEVKEALIRVGVEEPIDSGNKGSFAFVGYTGPEKVVWLKQIAKQRGQGPAKIITFIVTPEGAERLAHGDEEAYSDNEEFDKNGPLGDYDEWDKTMSKKSARAVMRALPEEEKAKISKLTEGLRIERNRLVTEISRWDERGNDIIVLAKKMCMIMMDMSDFTRGTGPLKTTMDVIRAAGRIAKCGEQMNKLGAVIAEQCPHSATRNDLIAYLQRIALYSHQLTITARVKADVQMISGEIVVSGLDSATSLIQSAKNLMNAVILTVKSSYVASTKHRQKDTEAPIVTWKMKAPEKKPLIKMEDLDARRTVRSSRPDGPSPIQALSEFSK